MKEKLKGKKGFTLIELIVVIAILAILAAVLLPKFMGFTDSAKMSAAHSDAKNIATAVESLIAQDKTFEQPDTTDGEMYGPKAVMGYVGKELGGELVLTLSGKQITKFVYTKSLGGKNYIVTYTASTGDLDDSAPAPYTTAVTPTATAAP